MAGDWIKLEKATITKPEIFRIAHLLGCSVGDAFYSCVKFWSWCDDHLGSCPVSVPVLSQLDLAIGAQNGFCAALVSVGWLAHGVEKDGSENAKISIPNLDRHMSARAKDRATEQLRKRRQRHGCVTGLSRKKRDKNRTREEKRREESISTNVDINTLTLFDRFWKIYPRKEGRRAAAKAWEAAAKRHPPEAIFTAAELFAASPKGKGEFCPHPKTWLNQDRFLDDPKEWSRSDERTSHRPATNANYDSQVGKGGCDGLF